MESLAKYRTLFLVEGGIFFVLGIIAILLPGIFTLGFEQLLGFLFVLAAFLQFYRVFK